jgi:hypothetical protein
VRLHRALRGNFSPPKRVRVSTKNKLVLHAQIYVGRILHNHIDENDTGSSSI